MTLDQPSRNEAFRAMLATSPERAPRLLERHPDSTHLSEPADSRQLEVLLMAELAASSNLVSIEADRHLTRVEYFLRSRVAARGRLARRRAAGMPAPFNSLLVSTEDQIRRFRLECGLVIFAQIALITSPEVRVELLKPLGTGLARSVANRLEREMARSLLISLPRSYVRVFMDLRRQLVASLDREELVLSLGSTLIRHAAMDLDQSLQVKVDAIEGQFANERVPLDSDPALSRRLIAGVMELFK